MSNLDKFMERGAHCVAGSIILRNKVMGNMRNGDLILTEDGLAELEVEEVVAKEPTKPAAKKAAPAAKKAAKPAEPEPADDLDLGDLGDLLPDLE